MIFLWEKNEKAAGQVTFFLYTKQVIVYVR
jgi:hypothetical protein